MRIDRRSVLHGIGVGPMLALPGGALARDRALDDLTPPNPDWLPSEAEATRWHERKVSKGPALTGNASWQAFLQFMEERLRAVGCIDVQRAPWMFDRMVTSMWPDNSKWSLRVAGQAVQVANAGANCGTTGPAGATAEMVMWNDASEPDVRGKIVVYRPVPRPEVRAAFLDSDYEVQTPYDSWPVEGRPVSQTPGGTNSISSVVWDEMTATSLFVERMRAAKPAGVIFAMGLNRAATAGLYTFGVPALYDFPSVYVDRQTGDPIIAEARAGRSATIRVEGKRERSEAYQLIAYLPGRDYATVADEQVWLRTHTDGPSISQDDGALGLLGVVRYIAHIPRAQRRRSLMIELDCRHFMPGMERAWMSQGWFEKHPLTINPIVAGLAMEHLGQIEYAVAGDAIRPTGRSLVTWVYATGNATMIDAALKASRDNTVRSTVIRSPGRPGVHGRDQGPWYGMGRVAYERDIPAYGVQGDLGAYWAHSAGMNRFDVRSFCRQVGMFSELTEFLMRADVRSLRAAKPQAKA